MSKLVLFLILFLVPNLVFGSDFKKIKKKATVNKKEIIFPIPKELKKCITNSYVNLETNPVKPLLKVDAPSGLSLIHI